MRLAQLDDLVVAACVAAVAVVALRVAAGLLLALAARIPGATGAVCRAAALRVTPALLRRVTVVALAGGAVAPLATAGAAGATTITVTTGDRALPYLDPSHGRAPTGIAAADPLDRGPVRVVAVDSASQAEARDRGGLGLDRGVVGLGAVDHGDVDHDVLVRPGDTLWSIAARHLGPGAAAADVARAWPRWYAANRARIGPDPSVIVPGQRLVPP